MAKGYWVGHVTVKNPERYKDYQALNAVVFAKYGGKFLVRGGQSEMGNGQLKERHVVLEFADYATAHACYFSPEYPAARQVLLEAADVDIAVVEGGVG